MFCRQNAGKTLCFASERSELSKRFASKRSELSKHHCFAGERSEPAEAKPTKQLRAVASSCLNRDRGPQVRANQFMPGTHQESHACIVRL